MTDRAPDSVYGDLLSTSGPTAGASQAPPKGNLTSSPRSGAHSLSGLSKTDTLVCESEPVALKPDTDYRLDGWINGSSGTARLGVDFLDERGRIISHQATPPTRAVSNWQYVALEANAGKATRARVWFRVKGRAELDDVGMAAVASSFMGNKGLEPDERGRIPFWSEEQDAALLPGRRAGEFRPDAEVKRGGKSSVLV